MVILGQEWIQDSNPIIDWRSGEVKLKLNGGAKEVLMRAGTATKSRRHQPSSDPAPAAANSPPPHIRIEMVTVAKQMEHTLRKAVTYEAVVTWQAEPSDSTDTGERATMAPTVAPAAPPTAADRPLNELLQQFKDVFVAPSTLPPLRPGFDHHIEHAEGNTSPPPAHAPYRLSWGESATLKTQLTDCQC